MDLQTPWWISIVNDFYTSYKCVFFFGVARWFDWCWLLSRIKQLMDITRVLGYSYDVTDYAQNPTHTNTNTNTHTW